MAALNASKPFSRRWRSESGAELIEVALTLPLLLLVVLGIIEFGFVFQQYEVVTNAAREGARVAVLPGYVIPDDATARVNDYLNAAGLNAALATVNATTLAPVLVGTNCMTPVQVTVAYPHPVPFIGGIMTYFGGSSGSLTLNASSTMRLEVAAATCS
jgi:Flp pilus assembly protein TadG